MGTLGHRAWSGTYIYKFSVKGLRKSFTGASSKILTDNETNAHTKNSREARMEEGRGERE